MKLLRRVANLGYGSRRQVMALFREGRITDIAGTALDPGDAIAHDDVRIDGESLDPPRGLVLMMDKPVGVTCSHRDVGRLVHDLLPPRYRLRKPPLSSVGRLDRDTSGLLLITDDGDLLHRIISPRASLRKVYRATLAEDLRGDEAGRFGSGTLVLASDDRPLAPAHLDVLGPREARLTVTEGRYHQVRRMFAAVGNHVLSLRRLAIGGLELEDMAPGQWRVLDAEATARIFDRRGT